MKLKSYIHKRTGSRIFIEEDYEPIDLGMCDTLVEDTE